MSTKITSKKMETNTLQKHDIKFCVKYAQDILKTGNFETVKEYIKKFFFRYKDKIFLMVSHMSYILKWTPKS